MFCVHCGCEIDDKALFCTECGGVVERIQTPPVVPIAVVVPPAYEPPKPKEPEPKTRRAGFFNEDFEEDFDAEGFSKIKKNDPFTVPEAKEVYKPAPPVLHTEDFKDAFSKVRAKSIFVMGASAASFIAAISCVQILANVSASVDAFFAIAGAGYSIFLSVIVFGLGIGTFFVSGSNMTKTNTPAKGYRVGAIVSTVLCGISLGASVLLNVFSLVLFFGGANSAAFTWASMMVICGASATVFSAQCLNKATKTFGVIKSNS